MTGYWRTKKVCEYFGVCRKTINRWIKLRGFPEPVQQAFREGNRWIPEDVIAWGEENIKTRDLAA